MSRSRFFGINMRLIVILCATFGIGLVGCVVDSTPGDPATDAGFSADSQDSQFSPDISGSETSDDQSVQDPSVISGTISFAWDTVITGSGQNRVSQIDITHGYGTVDREGSVPALIYEAMTWEEYEFDLYHVLAPTEDTLNVMYFYCGYVSEDGLDYVWHESYGLDMDYEYASGDCLTTGQSVDVDVELFNLTALPEPDELISGFAVDSEHVELSETGGTLDLDGREMGLYPFEVVDCTTDCTANPADGWWELHTMMEDEANGELCFGVLYLMLADPDHVSLGYGFCLQSLTRLDDTIFDAAWIEEQQKSLRGGNIPAGLRHPQLGYVLRPFPPM